MTIHRSSILWLSILSRNFRMDFLWRTSLDTKKMITIIKIWNFTSLVCPFTVVPFGLGRPPAFESPLRAKSCIFWTTFRSIVFTKDFLADPTILDLSMHAKGVNQFQMPRWPSIWSNLYLFYPGVAKFIICLMKKELNVVASYSRKLRFGNLTWLILNACVQLRNIEWHRHNYDALYFPA